MSAIFILIASIILAVSSAQNGSLVPSGRILDGRPVDTLRRFPHHVSIFVPDQLRNCSGSIISPRWILTSKSCVEDANRIELHFNRISLGDLRGSFSVSTDSSNVHIYPTWYDDIALVRLPVLLQFSETLRPIALPYGSDSNSGQLVVMAGFNPTSDRLVYGMFNVVSSAFCKGLYSEFDEYLQLCVRGWNGNSQAPCAGNQGGGLVRGWPNRNELIAVFSGPLECKSQQPARFTKVSEYLGWIYDITGIGGSQTPEP